MSSISPDELRRLADEDLMHLVRKGEARAFELIVERHQSAAFGLAYRMTGTRATAEDVVQESLVSLWRSNSRYDRARGSCAPGSSGSSTTGRSTRCAATRSMTAGGPATRASRSASRPPSGPMWKSPAGKRPTRSAARCGSCHATKAE